MMPLLFYLRISGGLIAACEKNTGTGKYRISALRELCSHILKYSEKHILLTEAAWRRGR